MRIFLTGYMGSGKSTVGKLLAYQMRMDFMDTDEHIELEEGRNIRQIFDEEGENYFREKEKQILNKLSDYNNIVVSTGGGMPCDEENIDLLNRSGITVYLKTDPETLLSRIRSSKKRPLLNSAEDLSGYVIEHLSGREKFYERCQLTVDANQPPKEVMLDIIRQFNSPWIL